MRTKIAIASLIMTLAACDDGPEPAGPERTAELAPSTDDAEVTVQHELTALRTVDADTDVRELARTLQPRMTRARFLRFTTSAIHDPVVAEVFIDRLENGNESPEVRAALVEALPRTGGEYADALLSMMGDEDEASVRTAMVTALRRAPAVQAQEGITLGLEDRNASVRAEAARVAGARPEIIGLEDALVASVGDSDAKVRAAATRSLGLIGADDRLEAVSAGLKDADPLVRLESVRALRRLDPAGAATKVSVLTDDEDEIVRKAAQRLQTTK